MLKIVASRQERSWCVILWIKSSILLTLRILRYYLHKAACEISDYVKDRCGFNRKCLVHYYVDSVFNPSNTENSAILFA